MRASVFPEITIASRTWRVVEPRRRRPRRLPPTAVLSAPAAPRGLWLLAMLAALVALASDPIDLERAREDAALTAHADAILRLLAE